MSVPGGACLRDWPYPRRIAHRGAGLLAPENTLAAFRLGASFGYRMFEFDVKLSSDEIPMLMHDDRLDRTTDGHGPFAALTCAELSRLDAGRWHSDSWSGERIPTLDAVAGFLRDAALFANIEIKPCPGREARTGECVAASASRFWRGAALSPLLSSFSEAALRAARDAAPDMPRALLLERPDRDWLERCRALGCVAVDVAHAWLTPECVDAAHAAGLRVMAYTVNDPLRAIELERWGVDALITDAVDRIAAVPDAA